MTILDALGRLEDEAPFDLFQGRFAYWRGFSGRRYIHSVYEPSQLDGFAGAVGILLNDAGAVLHVLMIDEGAAAFARKAGATSVHVHFPRSDDPARVRNDLRAALIGRVAAL